MLHTVPLILSTLAAPVCYEGLLGEGARQRRVIAEVASPARAVAHVYGRPARTVELTAATALTVPRLLSVDSATSLAVHGDSAVFTTSLANLPVTGVLHRREPSPIPPGGPGDWSTRVGPGGVLRLLVHVAEGPCGLPIGHLDSPDQGQTGLPVTAIQVSRDSIILEARYMDLRIAIPLAGEAERRGTMTQRGESSEITIRRGRSGDARPQEPRRPLPYVEREVAFASRDAAVRISGTLTLPRSPGPHPAVIFISGSGAQDRDETFAGHKPFLILSDHLTRQGYAVLRTDDRGAGGTTGNVLDSDLDDLVQDVLGALDFLFDDPAIDRSRIGLLGHSEGGYVAPIAAASDSRVAFLVLLAAPAVSGREVLLSQRIAMSRAAGTDSLVARLDSTMLSRILDALSRQPADRLLESHVDTTLSRWIAGLPAREEVVARRFLRARSAAADSLTLRLWRSRWFKGL
ncbi:MAG: alpha/beta hydrolase family protein, partial [Geminicoccaceae bacterium]|nr:alpha/beta hydrolase family protein [Geminicoccaceae bacterium]